jgi:glycosyltransferase involved in cell wall biosynthesis
MARINLLAWDNQRGLTHDIRLLCRTLTGLGHEVQVTRLGPRRHDGRRQAFMLRMRMWWQRLRHADWGRTPYDINIALEHVRPDWCALARLNLLVPNPEWLSPRSRQYLPRYDAILCKTRYGVDLFKSLGCRALHIGFDSTDCLDAAVPRKASFLHLAGTSRMKGTERLLALWRRHPEWPKLLVLQSPRTAVQAAGPTPANIEHRLGHVRDVGEVRQLQNAHLFHLCLSETEGWGHYIAEAMSCGAVVITSDAAPMNELVQADRGVLVKAIGKGSFNLASIHQFDESALEEAIERLTSMPFSELASLGRQAREWFETNEATFAQRVEAALAQLA